MRSTPRAYSVLIAVGTMGYPFMVYFALPHLSPRLLLLPALALIALRVFGARDFVGNGTAAALLLAGAMLLLLGVLAPTAAVRAYPVAMSLCAASAFGLSLVRGPSLVERMARGAASDLPLEAIRYMWWVTLVWCIFLSANAAIAAATAVFGTLAQWTWWNGLLFYFAAGLLFCGEYAVRRYTIPQPSQ
jgi:uncharacterized membrane protein